MTEAQVKTTRRDEKLRGWKPTLLVVQSKMMKLTQQIRAASGRGEV